MFKEITEGKAKLRVPKEEKISADLPVFYNPVMKQNRDISIEVLRASGRTGLQVCDLLAGTGARSIRFLLELPPEIIKSITINDADKDSAELIRKNIDINGLGDQVDDGRIVIENREASRLLLGSSGYDYIDIDPFGTPNTFLDAACKRIAREGILAVTATDTSALSGTFPKACQRKYWAKPRRDALMHETGLRILARKCQLVAAQYDKALIPILSYAKDHYMRIFFLNVKGKSRVDEVLSQHGEFNSCGPMWLGQLWDEHLLERMQRDELTELLYQESRVGGIGFHDLHAICKKNGWEVPKFSAVEEKLNSLGRFSRTHFTRYGIRTEADVQGIIRELLKKDFS